MMRRGLAGCGPVSAACTQRVCLCVCGGLEASCGPQVASALATTRLPALLLLLLLLSLPGRCLCHCRYICCRRSRLLQTLSLFAVACTTCLSLPAPPLTGQPRSPIAAPLFFTRGGLCELGRWVINPAKHRVVTAEAGAFSLRGSAARGIRCQRFLPGLSVCP